jgi:hypothetical protein
LIEADDEQIEEHPNNGIFEPGSFAEDFSSVIFFAFPEFPLACSSSCEVVGESHTPDGSQG